MLQNLWVKLLHLNHPVSMRTPAEIEAEVERNYPWNFTVNLLDGVAFWFGSNIVSSGTIIPLFISKLTLNPLIIGLVAVIAQAGWYLPQIFVAEKIEQTARKKPLVVNLGFFLERLPVLLWPLAALAAFQSPLLALVLFFGGFAWHHLGAGAVGPAWQDMYANCFPVNRRGRLFGLTTFLGGGMGIAGAILSAKILQAFPFPLNFFYTFLIAAVSIMVSWMFLALTREPIHPAPAPGLNTVPIWRKVGSIVQADYNFRQFLLARLTLSLGMMSMGFVTVSAVQKWQVTDGTVAFFTIALMIGQSAGNLLAGILADRFGHKLPLEVAAGTAAAGFGLAWLAPTPEWYYGVFGLLGMAAGATVVSGILITMEFSAPTRRATYVGIANSVVGLGGLISPLIGGLIAGISYNAMFVTSVGLQFLAVGLMHWQVKEPRRQSIPCNFTRELADDRT